MLLQHSVAIKPWAQLRVHWEHVEMAGVRTRGDGWPQDEEEGGGSGWDTDGRAGGGVLNAKREPFAIRFTTTAECRTAICTNTTQ